MALATFWPGPAAGAACGFSRWKNFHPERTLEMLTPTQQHLVEGQSRQPVAEPARSPEKPGLHWKRNKGLLRRPRHRSVRRRRGCGQPHPPYVRSFPLCSCSGSLDHIGRSIDPGYGSASPTQFHSKITITATDIKNIATAYVPHESQDQPTLKLLGNGCSPLCVDIWSEIWERRRFRS